MSRRRLRAVFLGAIALGSTTLMGSGISSAAGARTGTVNAPVANSVPAPVASGAATKVGAHNPAAVLQLHVGLAVRNSARLNRLIAGHVVLTRAQYAAGYAPTARQAAALSAWLKARGLRVTGIGAQNLWVKAEGSTAQVAHAFGISISDYRHNGRAFYANDQAPTVPASLPVSGVAGLSDYNRPRTFLQGSHQSSVKQPRNPVLNASSPFCPDVLSGAYSVNHNASGQTIDMVLWGAPLTASDVGLINSQCTGTQAVSVGSGADQVSFIPINGSDSSTTAWGEVALDIDNGHGIAPGSHINYYLGAKGDTYDAEVAAVDDSSSRIISNSWGYSANNDDVTDSLFEAVLQQGAALGKTIYFSTGDNSQISYPATSPNVVGVGGTSLTVSGSNSWGGESTWSDAGRGCSTVQPKPSWEVDSGCAGRAEPDVSADADPNTGAWACYSGSCHGEGGTSLAAPLWAGITADWNSQIHATDGGVGVGFDAPLLWRTSPTCAPEVYSNVITSNDNSTTIEKWPGGNPTLGSSPCQINIHQPSGDIDLIGGTAGVDSWGVNSVSGYTAANVDLVNVPDCESAGAIGRVDVNRPSCSNASTAFESGRSNDGAWFNTTPYHDVYDGSTGGIGAGLGWDYATGWGSPIFTELLNSRIAQAINFPGIATHTYGDSAFTITPTVSSGLGLTVASTTAGVCSVAPSGSAWTVTIVAGGSCSIQASQAGDSKYAAATSVTQSFTVNKASQLITFGLIGKQTLPVAPFGVTPTATSGLGVSVFSQTPGVCTVSSNTVSLVGPGFCSLLATQGGNGTYNPAPPVTVTFDVQTKNVVLNGGFEKPALGPGAIRTYFASRTLGGWSVTGGSIDLLSQVWQNDAGNQSIDLAGSSPGTITRTMTLPYSGTYTLRFAYAGNPGGRPTRKHMTVSADAPTWGSPVTLTRTFNTTGLSTGDMSWKSGKLVFAGTAGDVVTITFQDTDAPTPYGMALDAIVMRAS